jgi:hypothetical protein
MKKIFALLLALLATSTAYAQSAGPNGGILAGKGGHETELVLSPTELTVYIIDHGKVHSTKGVNLRAVVQQGGKSTTVQLADVDNKKLVGKLETPIGAGAIVVVTGKDDHGDVLTARYTIK